MKATKQFIEDAIEGGWMWLDMPHYEKVENVINDHDFHIEFQLLDPTFWQAVGKTRGWEPDCWFSCDQPCVHDMPGWKCYWRRFIEYLAEGLSIEDALTKLE